MLLLINSGLFTYLYYFIAGLHTVFTFEGFKVNSSHIVLGRASGSNQMCRYLNCLKMYQLSSLWVPPHPRLTASLLANIDVKR